jgi:uncharacterized protein (DUF433 family)
MVALRKHLAVKSEVVRGPSIMSGDPVVRGTRVPAMTIVAYLRAGRSNRETFEDYPTLPVDGIDAVIAWADEELGADWQTPETTTTKGSLPIRRGETANRQNAAGLTTPALTGVSELIR